MSRCSRLGYHSSQRLFHFLVSFVTTILTWIFPWPDERSTALLCSWNNLRLITKPTTHPGLRALIRHHNGITLLSPLSISFIRYTSLQQIVLSADNQEYILSASPIFGATESERLRFIPFYFNSTAHLSLIMSAAY
jgi:hypothetical protein